jgi:GNAT superfamily N-acetyltransferase
MAGEAQDVCIMATEEPIMEIIALTDPSVESPFDLLDGFLNEIGEAPLESSGRARIAAAIADGCITFFGARAGGAIVGISSLTTAYSTFAGGAPLGILEDVYVIPERRGTGVARALVSRVHEEARRRGCASVIVGCSEDDAPLYHKLGFTLRLGAMLSCVFSPKSSPA